MGKPFLFRKILISSCFLAFFPALVISYFLHPPGLRYRLETENAGQGYSTLRFADIDSDGVTEAFKSGKGYPFYNILIMDNDQNIFDQWNFKDTLNTDLSDYFFGNYDNDKFSEIYAFTYKEDSIFLNINEFLDPAGLKSDRLFITTIGIVNKTITSNVSFAGFYDVNGDGFKELYFTIQTGFGLVPRMVYYYDITSKKLKSGKFAGVTCQLPEFVDSDGDNKPEIFGLMGASGNYKTPTPFTDRSTWLMVYNENLEFEFPPVEFPGLTNRLEINSYIHNSNRNYLLFHNTNSADAGVLKPRLMIFSLDGNLLRERPISDFGFNKYVSVKVLDNKLSDRIFVFDKYFIELDSNLEIINKVKSPFDSFYFTFTEDVDNDGTSEFLFYSENEHKLFIYNTSLKKIAEADMNLIGWTVKFSSSIGKDGQSQFFIGSDDESYFVKMKKNKMFYFGYLLYPGNYLLCLLFILLIKRINTFQVVEKESLKQRLVSLQLRGIKAQLDPHFTFNTLNSVASLIYLEDRQSAYDYMNKFTQMLRVLLNDAERIYRSLGEEIEFVTTYLELEKLRFGDKFSYSIEIGEGISQKEQVPKLVLQTFSENAVKHGLMPCITGGMLKIKAEVIDDYLKLTVEDNGIGRERAEGLSKSTGKGLKLTGEFYEILNQINRHPIEHSITDLYTDEGCAAGTRVEVWVPLDIRV
jgi:hypothetical protein